MEMIDKINELKSLYVSAKNDKEREAINKKISELSSVSGAEFAEAMIESASQTADKAEQLALKVKLKEVSPSLSLSYISKAYFGKTRQWIYQRLNGSLVNGKPASFSSEEIDTLKKALLDISEKAKAASYSL